LIETKVAGQEIVAARASEPVSVINLVEALQKSIAETQKAASAGDNKSPKQKTSGAHLGCVYARPPSLNCAPQLRGCRRDWDVLRER